MDFHYKSSILTGNLGSINLFCVLLFVHILLQFPLKVPFSIPTPSTSPIRGRVGFQLFDQTQILLLFYHVFAQCFAVYWITHNFGVVLISFVTYLLLYLARARRRILLIVEEFIHILIKLLLVFLLL